MSFGSARPRPAVPCGNDERALRLNPPEALAEWAVETGADVVRPTPTDPPSLF
ncbi:hypothetical protein PEM37_08475 [Streptomyces sp. AD681]|uniref:hypothetical protein n=1 Tax=Streptomyces sp. AD681 TaxID=3019069 RepID=UPI0022F19AB9|nr:hypothetical protein [Streptomyces sp. AD681]MDA5141539.1 hypothetical protein [Streptomyces sp. AD681]